MAQRPAPDRVHQLAVRWVTLNERDREWGIVAEREFGRLSDDYLAQVIANRKRFSTYVEGLVKQGIAEGHFDPGLDLGLATDQVFAVLKSSHLLRRPRGTTGVAELAEAYARFIVRGLGDADWNPGGN